MIKVEQRQACFAQLFGLPDVHQPGLLHRTKQFFGGAEPAGARGVPATAAAVGEQVHERSGMGRVSIFSRGTGTGLGVKWYRCAVQRCRVEAGGADGFGDRGGEGGSGARVGGEGSSARQGGGGERESADDVI